MVNERSAPMGVRPQQPPSATLGDLLAVLRAVDVQAELRAPGQPQVVVHGMCLATTRVAPGDLFAALPGTRTHGASYVGQAVEAGAAAVLTDVAGAQLVTDNAIPLLVVDNVRAVLGELASALYQDPAASLTTLAVTGTQGKTTTTRLLGAALESAGVPSAVIGTVGTRVQGQEVATALTTPEAPDLQGLLAAMRESGVQVCAMEVSSHALVLGRVDGIRYDVATFLNLGRDHLDFHPDVESYYQAKAELFTPRRTRRAVINIDDEHGQRLAGEAAELGLPVRTFALDRPADWTGREIKLTPLGSEFVLLGPDGKPRPVRVPLIGRYNVSNAVAALASAAEAGLDIDAVAAEFATSGGVPGRMESVNAGQDFAIVVDYAHKPDAVAAACATLRDVARGSLIVVLGAGGDRDRSKRGPMGQIAAEAADVVIVTDDNPRTEDAESIRAAVVAGARGAGHAEVLEVGDRRLAIRTAIGRAQAGDIVLIAGKGHETGQEVFGVKHPFDDRLVAAEEVRAR